MEEVQLMSQSHPGGGEVEFDVSRDSYEGKAGVDWDDSGENELNPSNEKIVEESISYDIIRDDEEPIKRIYFLLLEVNC